MIAVKNLSFGFPDKDLYDQLNFTIEVGQSAALIGSSGCGKTTLVHMLRDRERYMYDGEIEIPEDWDMGYISQFYDGGSAEAQTVFQYIAQDFLDLQSKIEELCTKMEDCDDLETVLEAYQNTLDKFDSLDGENYESNINRKLGLAELTHITHLELSKISGGEFKLVQVIKAMLSTPKFIIMDEPDAFLDFENLNALKNLLNTHKGTMLTITHSRYLLNHCFNKIIHLENREIQEFDGNFIDYNFELLVNKVDQMEQSHKDTAEIARNEVIIERLRDAAEELADPSKGRALRARVKIQDRLEAKRIKAPFLALTKPAISITATDVAEDETILDVVDYGVTFDEILLENVNFQLKSTDKVAIIGKNGAGKTTLLRAIRDRKDPSIQLSETVKMAYLSQDQGDIM
ncbi:MAG: ATP-binding cassette domain-containing protein, partial [Eubacteriales bacterium]